MNTSIEWFQRVFHNITNEEDVVSNLTDLKIALSSLNINQLKYTTSSLNLSTVFDCLNSSEKDQIQGTCEVLKTFLSALDPSTILSQYGIHMARALNHPNTGVKELVLREMNRAACESDLSPRLSQEGDLLLSVAGCVGHADSSVSRPSIQFLVRLATSNQGLHAVYSPPVLQALNNVADSSDINRFRVFEITVEVSTTSIPGLEASHASGLLPRFLKELQQDDILALLTGLELTTKLALTHHGLYYLEAQGVTAHLATQLTSVRDNPAMSLVLPGLIKFFGNLAQSRPQETFQKYPNVAETVFKLIDDNDHVVVLVALETIGYIATTTEGKRTLQKKGEMMAEVMRKTYDVILASPTEDRVRGLNILANIIRLELSEQDTEMLSVTRGWFCQLPRVMAQLTELAVMPFVEIKLAVMLVLLALAEQPWGQECIQETPGLVELLVDRAGDSTMKEKNARFDVVRTLAESPTSESVFGEDTVKQFRRFLKEGAVYVQMQTEVAIEKAG